jgi:phospholipase/carboxylesterase
LVDGLSKSTIAGLRTRTITAEQPNNTAVVLLHGYAMQALDLAQFAQAMNLPATFYFPDGPHPVAGGGRCWWQIDRTAREAQQMIGPRDLYREHPPGREAARRCLHAFLNEVAQIPGQERIILGGFSQGGMLACEMALLERAPTDGLVLLSASRIAVDEWTPNRDALRGLPVFISHGHSDHDLAFDAGLELKRWVEQSGARVTWLPFDGGHQVPFVVWRGLRKFLSSVINLIENDATPGNGQDRPK